jgi:ribonuclease HI
MKKETTNNTIFVSGYYKEDGAGYFVCDEHMILLEHRKLKMGITSVESEYYGIISALQFAEDRGTVYTSNQTVQRQISGEYLCKAKHLKQLLGTARRISNNKSVTVAWIPKCKNLAGIVKNNEYYSQLSPSFRSFQD